MLHSSNENHKVRRAVYYSAMYAPPIVLLYPLRVIKTRQQAGDLFSADGTTHQRRSISIMRNLIKSEGYTGIFKGVTTFTSGMLLTRVVQFGSYDLSGKIMNHNKIAASVISGAVTGLALVPTEVVTQRMHVQSLALNNLKYSGGIDAIKRIYQSEGLRAFYKGYYISLTSLIPFSIVYFNSFEQCKKMLPQSTNWMTTFGAAAASGTLATISSLPFDVIKTRLQLQSRNRSLTLNSIASEVLRVHKNQGLSGFFKGCFPRVMTMAPMAVINLWIHEVQQSNLQ